MDCTEGRRTREGEPDRGKSVACLAGRLITRGNGRGPQLMSPHCCSSGLAWNLVHLDSPTPAHRAGRSYVVLLSETSLLR